MDLAFPGGRLRPWRLDDCPPLARYANNRNVSRFLRDAFPYPYSLKDAEAFITRVVGQQPPQNLAIVTSSDEPIGGVGLRPQEDVNRRSMEIGYWLGEPFWGKGLMTAAVRTAVEYAFSVFDVVRLYATVYEGNDASRRVVEKAGFVLEGRLRMSIVKDGRMLDSFLYAMLKTPR